MKTVLFTLLAFISQFAFAQQSSQTAPFSSRDSVYISGKVIDENGKPMDNVMVLVYPFYTEKFGVTWHEQDTFYTHNDGRFIAALNGGQFHNQLFFKTRDCLLSTVYLPNKMGWIFVDEPVKMFSRKTHFYDTRKIDKKDLAITVEEALKKYKVELSQTRLFSYPVNWANVKGLRFETADSSVILLATENVGNIPARTKNEILDRKITGIGIAFANGDKILVGNGLDLADGKIYNEHYLERKELEAKQKTAVKK